MINNKQSSVEWLEEIIRFANKELYAEMFDEIEQAKAMHKEEMVDFAFKVGRGQDYDDEQVRELAEIIYNETFNQ